MARLQATTTSWPHGKPNFQRSVASRALSEGLLSPEVRRQCHPPPQLTERPTGIEPVPPAFFRARSFHYTIVAKSGQRLAFRPDRSTCSLNRYLSGLLPWPVPGINRGGVKVACNTQQVPTAFDQFPVTKFVTEAAVSGIEPESESFGGSPLCPPTARLYTNKNPSDGSHHLRGLIDRLLYSGGF